MKHSDTTVKFDRTPVFSALPVSGTNTFMKNVGILFLTVLASCFFSQPLLAQGNTSAHNGQTDEMLEGPDALFLNPAYLHADGAGHSYTLSMPGVNISAGGGLINIPVYNQYLTNDLVLDRATQQQMLNAWFPGGSGSAESAGMDIQVSGLGLGYSTGRHSFGLSQNWRVLGRGATTKGVLEAGFGGVSQELFGEPTPLNMSFESALLMQLTAGYSYRILDQQRSFFFGMPVRIYAGMAPSLILGYQGMQGKMSSSLHQQGDSLSVHRFTYNFSTHGQLSRQLQEFAAAKQASGARQNPDLADFIDDPFSDIGSVGGYGFGMNLGVRMKADLSPDFLDLSFFGKGVRSLDLGLALIDLGSAKYGDDAARFSHSDVLEWRGINLDDRWIDNEFDGNVDDYVDFALSDSLGSDVYLSYDADPASSYSINLPTRLAFSSQLTAGRAATHMNITKGFNTIGLNSRRLVLNIGLEYRIPRWLPLRAGLRTGGSYGTRFDTGFGIMSKSFELDLAVAMALSAEQHGSWTGVSLGSRFKF